jgi:hypothetical protein
MKLQPSLEHGRVRERLMRPVLKTEMGSEPARVGSNPTSSAMIADVAQQAERSPCKGRVAGSNPCHRLQRFMAWLQPSSHRFESCSHVQMRDD